MIKTPRSSINQIVVFVLLTLGILFTVLSGFYISSFLTILGLALIFWGVILLYITPNKHVPLILLDASFDTSNIERILTETGLTLKGIYLPPKNLKDIESSLVFFPKINKNQLPNSGDLTDTYLPRKKTPYCLLLQE